MVRHMKLPVVLRVRHTLCNDELIQVQAWVMIEELAIRKRVRGHNHMRTIMPMFLQACAGKTETMMKRVFPGN